MLSTVTRKKRRPTGFAISALLHAGTFSALVFGPQPPASIQQRQPDHQYSVLVLRLEDFRPRPKAPGQGAPASKGGVSAPQNSVAHNQDQSSRQNQNGPETQSLADAISPPEPGPRRQFVLPPTPRRDPVRQTLVQPDAPPELQLAREIPLPTVLLWERLPQLRKTFVAPAVREMPKRVAEVPEAPELLAPNRELMTASLKVASQMAESSVKLARTPAKTAPIRGIAVQPMMDSPQIAISTSSDSSLAALISLPDTPVLSGQTVVIPPANQIAASGSAGSGSSGTGQGSQNHQPGSSTGSGQSGADANSATRQGGANRGSGTPGQGGIATQGLVSAAGSSASGAGRSPGNAGTGSLGTGSPGTGSLGTGSLGTGSPGTGSGLPLPGTTLLNFPKEGKYGLVVTGPSLAAPYAESNGALSGRIIYSVFVNVGLRKKWVLQYCLVKAEEKKTPVKGRALPVEAPWPYKVVRPDDLGNANRDYVIVHGILSADGRFEQLAMIFPLELAGKDLLISSLKQWLFRPAARDGVPSEIEILLIIPGQAE